MSEEMEAVLLPRNFEKPEMDEFKTAKSDISDTDTGCLYTIDEQQNEDENFKMIDVSVKV